MNKHDNSEEAKVLKNAASKFHDSRRVLDAGHPNLDKRWRALSRAALAYARLVYAGQCFPKREE